MNEARIFYGVAVIRPYHSDHRIALALCDVANNAEHAAGIFLRLAQQRHPDRLVEVLIASIGEIPDYMIESVGWERPKL